MIHQLRLKFDGSWQCRLATEPAATGASPKDPYGDYGLPKGLGWTFAYKEKSFDRIIRIQKANTIDLRAALVDPWKDVTVGTVEVDKGAGFTSLPTDAFVGQQLSIGSAKFDTAAGGGGMTNEALSDFQAGIGSLLTADPDGLPMLNGALTSTDPTWLTEYRTKKPGLIAATPMDAVRKKALSDYFLDTYASFFPMKIPCKPFRLKNIRCPSPAGVLLQMTPPLGTKYTWTMDLAFYRFDGDTLTGKLDGQILAKLGP